MKTVWKYLITFAVAAVICVLALWARGLFSAAGTAEIMRCLSDGFFIAGFAVGGYGLLVVCSNGGAFDILAYGMICFFSLFRKDVKNRKAKTFYEYRKAKSEKRHSFAYLLIVGLAFVLIAVLFVVLFYVYS